MGTHGDQSQAIAEMKFGNGLLVMAFFCNMEARAKPVNANLRVKVSVTDSDANGTPPQGARLKPIEAEPKPDPSLTPMGEPETDPEVEPEPDPENLTQDLEQKLEEIIKEVDEDGNGMIDVDEFLKSASSMEQVKDMKEDFKLLDKDGSGYVEKEELAWLISRRSKPKAQGARSGCSCKYVGICVMGTCIGF